MAALLLLRDKMQGEAYSEYRDLRKGFNTADYSQKHSPSDSIKNTPCRCYFTRCMTTACNLREAPWQNVFLSRTQFISD